MKKVFVGIAVGILFLGLLAVVAYASGVYTFGPVPGSVKVVSPVLVPGPPVNDPYKITVWQDGYYTKQMKSIAWGDVAKGQSKIQEVYVRNDGINYVSVAVDAEGLPDGISISGSLLNLPPDSGGGMRITLEVGSMVAAGSYSFSVFFRANPF
jgi:hypothetical protein